MRPILTVEQAQQVAADIQAWLNEHATNTTPLLPDDTAEAILNRQQRWQAATIKEFMQLVGIQEMDCYFVEIDFGEYSTSFVLQRWPTGLMRHIQSYTFRPPNFTHPAQENK